MSNTLKYLPEKRKLKKQLNRNPDDILYYKKYNSFIGSTKSIKYLLKRIKHFNKKTEIS